jgi:hypothetical protein
MSLPREALERISRAGHQVRLAADRWNAADHDAVENCARTLAGAATELSGGLEVFRGSRASSGDLGTLTAHLRELRKSASRLERLVDSSACFLRYAPGLACQEPGLYEPGGSLRYIPPAMETRGMQV